MAYEKLVSRATPGVVVLVFDDSGSMADPLSGTMDAKYLWNERYGGIVCKDLLARSTDVRGDAVVVKPRYFVYVIRYGSRVEAWGSGIMDIQTAVEKYTQEGNSFGLGGKLSGTDAKGALERALRDLRQITADERFAQAFPPLVLHLTDGMSQTDPTAVAEQIKQLATSDGHVLMANAFIGTQTSLAYSGPEDFPGYVDASEAGPSNDNGRMFHMSSVAPDSIRQNLVADGVFPNFRPGARLFFDVRTKAMLMNVIQVVSSVGSRADR